MSPRQNGFSTYGVQIQTAGEKKEWASSLSLRQRSGLNSNYKGSLKYFSERVVAFIFYLSSRISYMTDQGDSNFEYYRDVYVQSS